MSTEHIMDWVILLLKTILNFQGRKKQILLLISFVNVRIMLFLLILKMGWFGSMTSRCLCKEMKICE